MSRGQQVILSQSGGGALAPSPLDHADPPEHLSDAARELWVELFPELAAVKMITTHDLLGLSMLCEAYADWVGARAELAENGGKMYYTDGRGVKRVHPAHYQLSDADRRLRGWCQEFALSPAVRLRFMAKAPAKIVGGDIPEEDVVDLSGLTVEEREALRTLAERRVADEIEARENQ